VTGINGRKGVPMTRFRVMLLVTASVLVSLCANAMAVDVAIRRAGGQGWGATTLYGSMFDPKTVGTVEGVVLSVERFIPLRQMGWGLLVRLETKTEVISVHVGPGWFIQDKGFEILRGDRLEVRGSRIVFDGQPAIIATEVKKGGDVLRLRNDNGVPVWSEAEGESG